MNRHDNEFIMTIGDKVCELNMFASHIIQSKTKIAPTRRGRSETFIIIFFTIFI